MKFQDNVSNMNTYIRTYIHRDKPKPICPPPLFQSWGHNYNFFFGGGGGGPIRGWSGGGEG